MINRWYVPCSVKYQRYRNPFRILSLERRIISDKFDWVWGHFDYTCWAIQLHV